jgi:hypothetical protein
MNVDNRKIGLWKSGVSLNQLINFLLSYSFHRANFAMGTNKNVFSLFMIREPTNGMIIVFVNSTITYNLGTTVINGWSILNNPVND